MNALILNIFIVQLVLVILGLPSTANAQIKSTVLYCCNNDQNQKVCSDKRSACWGRETQAIDQRGMTVERIPPPLTRAEKFALAEAERARVEAEKQKLAEDLHFRDLLSVYGSAESIDREIERQEKESNANIKITESRLQTAKDNVVTCRDKLARKEKTNDCNEALLAEYQNTVTAIELEIVERRKQTEAAKTRLLATKQEILNYKNVQQ